jgi:rare lipoprotein A (peptidoglycan hydrolase)
MRLLSGLAIAMVIAWTVTQPSPAGAQNFDDRFSIIPKANAAEPSGENKEVPQTEPADVPQTQPAQSQPPGEGRSTSGSEDRSTTRASKRNFTASKRSFTGRASYYSYRTGKTASGSLFNRDLPTAAHRSLPFGTRVRVTDLATRKSVIVTITDRGPRVPGRMLDLSLAAARTLGMTERGVVNVRVEVL